MFVSNILESNVLLEPLWILVHVRNLMLAVYKMVANLQEYLSFLHILNI